MLTKWPFSKLTMLFCNSALKRLIARSRHASTNWPKITRERWKNVYVYKLPVLG